MLRQLLQRLNFVGRWRARQTRRKQALAFAAEFHRQDRERIAKMAAEGRSDEALKESLSALGIDPNKDRPRIVEYYGIRVRD